MHTQWLKIKLETALVLTRHSVTEGAHETLDYIPGSTLLGAAAAEYRTLGHDVFWSGRVRFGNGLPWDGELGWPMPLCFYAGKGDDASAKRGNFLRLEESQPKNPQQERSGYLTVSRRRIKVNKSFQLKTAIDRERLGTSKESQLFGYESIQSGQEFVAQLEADATIPGDTFARIITQLCDKCTCLGRSRSAEYGQVSISRMAAPAECATDHLWSTDKIAIYCASDLALTDSTGSPTLTPSPEHFGLAGTATFDPKRSALRVRNYWPWNSHLGGAELSRNVITAGSVLVFKTEGGTPPPPSGSFGAHRQSGLGRVLFNPAFVLAREVQFQDSRMENTTTAPPPLPVDPLISLVRRRHGAAATGQHAVQKSHNDLVPKIQNCLKLRKAWNEPCPTPSQWSGLRAIAASGPEWKNDLRKHLGGGIRRQQWKSETEGHDLLKILDEIKDPATLHHVAALMGRETRMNDAQALKD